MTTASTGVPVHASTPSPDAVRTHIADLLTSATAGQPGTSTNSLLNAAIDGVEDVAVATRTADRSETAARYDHRLGQWLAHDIDRLFQACAAAAIERGDNPKRAVTDLVKLLHSYSEIAAKDALVDLAGTAVA